MELVAPAGGPEQLRMALHFGADTVYVGARRWSMRARSENFSDGELAAGVVAAHARGARVNVALNCVMTDADTDDLPDYLRFIDDLGVDAAIVADLGVVELVREHAPHVQIHLSTQASVMSAAAADAWARQGVRRIVLAREMRLEQIAALRRRCSAELELEAFVHGSMCMAYSGRCLLSAELMGPARSASWGSCAQPCRWGWSLMEERSGAQLGVEADERGSYLLSSNDLCMIEHLDALAEAGVQAAKIEGRSKGSYYTACVVNAYRHVLDGASVAPWRAELDAVSHRPYSTGFYFGEAEQNPGHVEYARERQLVAVVESSQAEGDMWLVELRCRNRVDEGAEVQVLAPDCDVRTLELEGLEACDEAGVWQATTRMARNGGLYRFRSRAMLTAGDLLCARIAG